jgi:hypothetical protein
LDQALQALIWFKYRPVKAMQTMEFHRPLPGTLAA